MLVTFRSTATDSITMFGDTAAQLLQLLGASGKVPGAFTAADVPVALQRLEAGLHALKLQQGPESQATAALPAGNEDAPSDDEDDKEPPIQIEVRAIPLIGLLRRAAAAKAEVMWE